MPRAGRRKGWISTIEAIHAPIAEPQAWMSGVTTELAGALGIGPANIGYIELTHSADVREARVTSALGPSYFVTDDARRVIENLEPEAIRQIYYPPSMVTTLGTGLARFEGTSTTVMRDYLSQHTNGDDIIGVTLHPQPGVAAVLYAELPRALMASRETRRLLTKFGLHLETNVRARRHPETVVAVLTPDGKIEHLAKGAPPREQLTERVAHVERARTGAQRSDPNALDLWPALIGGRASLVEHMEGHRRYYRVVANAPTAPPIRALGEDEIVALSYATRGMSLKTIAYALGSTESTISNRLAAAASKIGTASTIELVRIAAMFANDPRARFPKTSLTTSETDILDLLRQGFSNQQIASLRQRSVRTIANQVSSLLRKTGTGSRRELVAAAP